MSETGPVRADRLVATLLLLQARGRVTAAEVAEELEVSVRTARRDLEALSLAGIPVQLQTGRGGGWSLVGGARTDLSGLTAAQAQALFLVAGPSAAVTPEAKAALRKLVRALPETFRDEAEKAAAAVVLDAARWGGTAPPAPPHLDALQRAVVAGVRVRLDYRYRSGTASEWRVDPLGLVAKGSVWYLVAGTDAGLRTFRVGGVQAVTPTAEPVVRCPGSTWPASGPPSSTRSTGCGGASGSSPGPTGATPAGCASSSAPGCAWSASPMPTVGRRSRSASTTAPRRRWRSRDLSMASRSSSPPPSARSSPPSAAGCATATDPEDLITWPQDGHLSGRTLAP